MISREWKNRMDIEILSWQDEYLSNKDSVQKDYIHNAIRIFKKAKRHDPPVDWESMDRNQLSGVLLHETE